MEQKKKKKEKLKKKEREEISTEISETENVQKKELTNAKLTLQEDKEINFLGIKYYREGRKSLMNIIRNPKGDADMQKSSLKKIKRALATTLCPNI